PASRSPRMSRRSRPPTAVPFRRRRAPSAVQLDARACARAMQRPRREPRTDCRLRRSPMGSAGCRRRHSRSSFFVSLFCKGDYGRLGTELVPFNFGIPSEASMAEVVDRYAPARRLHQLKALLNSSGGVTVTDIAERLRVSVKTATRYLQALDRAGEPLYEETVDRHKVWRLRASARYETITLTTSQMVALFLSGRVFDFLKGTGFKEDLDDVSARLEAMLKRKDFVAARHLDRKIFDVNEAPHVYAERVEDVNDITTALIREERLRVRHDSVSTGR